MLFDHVIKFLIDHCFKCIKQTSNPLKGIYNSLTSKIRGWNNDASNLVVTIKGIPVTGFPAFASPPPEANSKLGMAFQLKYSKVERFLNPHKCLEENILSHSEIVR